MRDHDWSVMTRDSQGNPLVKCRECGTIAKDLSDGLAPMRVYGDMDCDVAKARRIIES